MWKLNPETMKIDIGGGHKDIAITKQSIWCLFQIPNVSGDPPIVTDDKACGWQRELGAQICGRAYKPKVGIRLLDIVCGFKDRTLTGYL